MPIYQSFNPKIKAWVKYHFTKEGIEFTDVKQKKPRIPFKGIPKKGVKK
jgi:hypothetical protein